MTPKYLIIACMLFLNIGFTAVTFAGEIKYPFADIPKSLLKDAKAVIRDEEIVVEVRSNSKLVQKVRYAITILNKNGARNANFVEGYNKNIKISNIRAQLYDASGNEIKKKGGFEILDYAMISDFSIYEENRLKGIDPGQYDYPFTIEYSYEETFSDVIYYPDWNPVRDYNISIENSRFTLIVANDANCRYYEKNLTSKAKIVNSAESKTYSWELAIQPALLDENLSPALSDYTPAVLIAPSKVKVEGYEGNFETWTGFGLWINQLNQDRNNLSPETKAKLKKMTEGITDDRTKIKTLYEYMQNKTRYVSIQVGIGGFQPFDAETVDRLSYGDCKALSNYMKSLLDAVGISARYTLINSGEDNPSIQADFPSTQFNHVILCVPMKNDTVWLECTSQRKPFNYLGISTCDREALVMEPDGGKLVHTPVLKPEEHLESRKVDVTLDNTGSGFAYVKSKYSGATYDNYVSILMSDQTDRKKMVTRRIHVPNFELDNFNIAETKSELPYVTENLNLTINSYCTKVGEKMMLCLNMMNKLSESPFQAATRKTDVSIKWPIFEIDTVTYTLPQGYSMEKIPSKVSIQSDFGKYTTTVTKSGSDIQYVRTFMVNKGEYPVDRYDEIVTFFDKIVTADENKVMLTRSL
jgi:transglutaminase-like putative cysteine protease